MEAGVKVRDRPEEEIAKKNGRMARRRWAMADLVTGVRPRMRKKSGNWTGVDLRTLQDEGHGAMKGQRAGADKVLVGLIDVLGILLQGKVRKGA